MEKCDRLLPPCSTCAGEVGEPYIECAECENINLCLQCFANGKEAKKHKNSHSYSVRRNDFPLFENSNWTAKEEYALIEAVSAQGYGNWEDVSKKVKTRSKLECQEHYRKYYIDNPTGELPLFPDTVPSLFPPTVTPHLFSQTQGDEPPRELGNQHTAGYNAFRSDFEVNFDSNAETMFNTDLIDTPDDKELINSLKCAVLMSYNNRLRERHRRYDVMKEHGLVIPRKLTSWLHRFDASIGRPLAERLCVFMQFMSALQFDAFMESVHQEYELNAYLQQLTAMRQNGITTFKSAVIYNKLKHNREAHFKEMKNMANDQTDWRNLNKPDSQAKLIMQGMLLRDLDGKNQMKRILPPLDIVNLPNYEKLSEKERDLCTSVRLLPQNYLDIKSLLIVENDKLGFLRLLDARRLIKIDVNKTRRIYDFLVREGFIRKPQSK